jgi:oleate hydratase
MNIYKTMYHAPKPAGIENRKAYIIGGGIAGLATAAFLVDDAQMPGANITILEKHADIGGSMDGARNEFGYVCRGERELEPYMECLWYLCSKIPSLENPGRTVLDDIVDFNKDEPIHSEARVLVNQGQIYSRVHDYKLSPKNLASMTKLLATPEEELEDRSIEDYFDPSFFESNLWLCFHSCLAFKRYHSIIEARRYWQRFSFVTRHEYLEGIIHTKYNERDAIIRPIETWLYGKGVKVVYNCSVYDLELDAACNTAQTILMKQDGQNRSLYIGQGDLVFVTNGSMTTNCAFGDNQTVAPIIRDTADMGVFTLWQNLAKKDAKFGSPDKFISSIDKTKWISFFPTIKGYPQFVEKIEKMTGSKAGTGGAITIKDSSWDISFVLHHRPFYPDQANDEDVFWGYGLYGENVGDYIKKPMCECTGDEMMTELLYHLGLLEMKDELLAHTYVSTCMMPYITSQFMPRKVSDRPRNVPEGCVNLAFIGQYVEIQDDVVFTVETSVRTGLEAVYTLLHLDKDILDVYPSKYDIRYTVERLKKFSGIKGKITEEDLPRINPLKLGEVKKQIIDQLNAIPPYYEMYTGRDRSVAHKESVLHPEAPQSK